MGLPSVILLVALYHTKLAEDYETMSILIVKSQSHNPFFNLALEDFLLQQMAGVQKDTLQAILYLWQNENTVVIGRNQNAWAECKTELLEAEGGRLARRTTGGGAVFHDLGNLNFSFLMPQADFDIGRNFQIDRRHRPPGRCPCRTFRT